MPSQQALSFQREQVVYSVTLEWNAVTTWEDAARPSRPALERIVKSHGQTLDVGIVTTAASENTREQTLPSTASEFRDRLSRIGWSELTLVNTRACIGLTYIGLCQIASQEDEGMINDLWSAIAPSTVPKSYRAFAEENKILDTDISAPTFQKWRNVWCDVYSIHAHIRSGRDAFVTGDTKNFKGDKKAKLQALGLKEIYSYCEAVEVIPVVP